MTPGFLVVDKPDGLTSHDVVGLLRAVLGGPKVGHAGTLDPFATGVLIVALGTATRLLPFLDDRRKVYEADVALGARTDTGDRTGDVVETAPVRAWSEEEVDAALAGLLGPQMQRPPAYSAVKVDGRKLYDYARAGRPVEAPPRPITVFAAERRDGAAPEPGLLRVRLEVSRGTYVRVLAEDLGVALGTLAHTAELRRTSSGGLGLDRALTLQALSDAVAVEPGRPWLEVLRAGRVPREQRPRWRTSDEIRASLAPWWIAPGDALPHLPAVAIDDADRERLAVGQAPRRRWEAAEGPVRLMWRDRLVAVVTPSERGPEHAPGMVVVEPGLPSA